MLLLLLLSSLKLSSSLEDYPFMDPSLPWNVRVDDLVSRMTLEDITGQTMSIYDIPTPPIPRLNVKPYYWNSECLHGQVSTNTTSFPQSLGLAASFNESLLLQMTKAISIEQRGHWNTNRKIGYKYKNVGLSCFSPVINIMRHPLWGRNQETYGEDPFLSGTMAKNFVNGLQGSHPRYIRSNAGCKHFDVHGGPENIPTERYSFSANVSMANWRMTFLPQFKMCVDAGTYSLMCSYNSINGVPACANNQMLTSILRDEWNFTGYVVSDAGAIENIITYHKYLPDKKSTVTASIKAGCNLELGSTIYTNQIEAMHEGLLSEEEISENVKPLMYTRMRLGEFDPEDMNPYNKIEESDVVQSPEHRLLSLEAAMQTFVLLKNNHNILPLKRLYENLAFVGPFFSATDQLFGNYASNMVPEYITDLATGLSKLSSKLPIIASGCLTTDCPSYNQSEVVNAVADADLIILALGTGYKVEGEANDRYDLDLPGQQLNILLDAVNNANSDANVLLLIFNAGPLDITFAKYSDKVAAILECYFPGQTAGDAVYNILTASAGPVSIPAARLPNTWPAFLKQVPPITDYDMKGHTYRYYEGVPLYPFGFGLSYTRFVYSSLHLYRENVPQNSSLSFTVNVANVGYYDAFEVTQVYVSWPPIAEDSIPIPKIQLVAFQKSLISMGQDILLKFIIATKQFQVWSQDEFTVLKGVMRVYVGGQQPLQFDTVPSNILSQTFNIV